MNSQQRRLVIFAVVALLSMLYWDVTRKRSLTMPGLKGDFSRSESDRERDRPSSAKEPTKEPAESPGSSNSARTNPQNEESSIALLGDAALSTASAPNDGTSSFDLAPIVRAEPRLDQVSTQKDLVAALDALFIRDFPAALAGSAHLNDPRVSSAKLFLEGCVTGEIGNLEVRVFTDLGEEGIDPMRGRVVTELLEQGSSYGLQEWAGILGAFRSLGEGSRAVLVEVSKQPKAYLQLYRAGGMSDVVAANLYLSRDRGAMRFAGSLVLKPSSRCRMD